MTPDPANPQSWNRYAYVMNNPLNATDPLGLQSASQNDQCSPNSARPIGDGTARVPGLECGTGALDSSDPGDAPQCSTDPNAPCIVIHKTAYGPAEDPLDQSELIASISEMLNHMAIFDQLVHGTQDRAKWALTFTKSFLTFKGGPGNKPTCAGQTLKSIGNDLTGGLFRSQAAETSLKAASAYQEASAVLYAATKPNTLGGIGLICPSCSSVYRSMMEKAEFLGEASEAVPLIETSYAAGSSIPEVSGQARSGECAAAFPVF